MSVATTRGIRVSAEPTYLADRSDPRRGQFLFAYTITITNLGEETVQLVAREWVITDADGDVETVAGPGVVGQQPVLRPGASHRYTSYCPLATPVGTMQGRYAMRTETGETFHAEIAPFTLTVPHAVN
ncbi:MAG TPA: Co2+/Mg2+ efflux protein ApaG [Thermoanaerobaculia bacterium]|nr:Co2+/Mg2+ efflux protein ApaG [Thermoanaerobaculia bacterium]